MQLQISSHLKYLILHLLFAHLKIWGTGGYIFDLLSDSDDDAQQLAQHLYAIPHRA